MAIGPLKFSPIFKERIWGSRRLMDLYDKALPVGVPIGESWELADLPADCTAVAEGPLAGTPLRNLLSEKCTELGFSRDQAQPPFGLLIKFLSAEDSLSVQVHPDAAACRELPGAQLKTECWYVLHADPGSVIYRGLKPGVDRAALVSALNTGTVAELLQQYPAEADQFHLIPAGTVHALGAGIVVAEIQTPSDTTYRLYDWDRTDAQGHSRELHIDQALHTVRFPQGSPPTAEPSATTAGNELHTVGATLGVAELLLDCSYFAVVRVDTSSLNGRTFTTPLPFVMIVIDGRGTVTANGIPCHYRSGDTVMIPKTSNATLKPELPGRFIFTCLGHDITE